MGNSSNKQADTTEALFMPDMLEQALEALFFVACEPLTLSALSALLQAEEDAVQEAARSLEQRYAGRGFRLARLAGGWQFVTPEEYAPLIERLYRPKYQQLSRAALETLSIIAYKQPVTRAEISDIRQVDSDGVVSTLLEKGLIMETGRLSSAGRAILYGTSPDFLAFFGLDSLNDLPPLPQVQEDTPAE